MEDLIKRSDAMEAVCKGCLEESKQCRHRWMCPMLTNLVRVSSADRPQGEWKSVKASIYPYGYDVVCSVCGHRMGSSFGYKFCPMCGASMKGADDEE